ncbi:AIF1L factor, partial [Panurus biarmicus]|nr:AIF1L factor [Panurus biarmicus]
AMAAPRRPSGGGQRRAPQDGRLDEINKVGLGPPPDPRGEGAAMGAGGTRRRGGGGCSDCLALVDLMSVKRMMEKLGAPKTHLELKKMISEVTGGVSDTISYQDFVNVMLGKRSAVLKLVMMFEGKANESNPKPSGPPPERDIASLP